MKLKTEFVVQKVGEKYIAVPIGQENSFKGMINLNETGVFIFNSLKKDTTVQEMVTNLMKEFNVEFDRANGDVTSFIEKMKSANLIDE